MRYVEFENRIHGVYDSLKEWRSMNFKQRLPVNYLTFIRKHPECATVRDLRRKYIKVGLWIGVWAGKNKGVMQLLAIKRYKSRVIFKTPFGWEEWGNYKVDFNPARFRFGHAKLSTAEEINFAAAFALHGNLAKAYAESHPYIKDNFTKKKFLPHFSKLSAILPYAKKSGVYPCHVN